MTRSAALGTALVAALVLSACAGSTAPAPAPEAPSGEGAQPTEVGTVRLATVPVFANLPGYVAMKEGIYEEHGLNVEFNETNDFAGMLAAVGNTYDIVATGASGYLAVVSAGRDLTVVNNLVEATLDSQESVMVTKQDIKGDYSQLPDGVRVGVPALSGTTYASIVFLLENAGVKDPQYVQMAYPQQLDNLNADNLDAVISTVPFTSEMVADGYFLQPNNVLAEAPSILTDGRVENASGALYASSTDWAETNPAVADAWLAAMRQTMEWINSNPDRARAYLAEWTGMDPSATESLPVPNFNADFNPAWFELDWELGALVGANTGDFPEGKTKIWGK